MIKVYFGSHPVYLLSQEDSPPHQPSGNNEALFLSDLSESSLIACWQLLEKPGTFSCVYQYHDLPLLKDTLLASATTIVAGGGVVFNQQGQILLIYRRGKWDLPKGKLDLGESIEACALREVMEETGLKNVTLQKKIGTSYYCYAEKEQRFLKQVEWYKMVSSEPQTLTPQLEEDITDIKWIDLQALEPYLENTYATIKDVLLLSK